MKTARICAIVLLLLELSAQVGLAATLNFSASDEYIIKGDAVVFTFTYERGSEGPAENLQIEFDYDGDGETEYTLEKNNPAETENLTKTVVFNTPGYFESKATFILTYGDGEIREELELGTYRNPRRINVANWKFTAGGCIESTPALSPDGSTVYFGSADHHIYAVSTQDGTQKWRRNLGGDVDSSPAVDASGYVYVGSEDGHVYCLEPETGAVTWRFPAGSQGRGHFFSSSALDEEQNRLYIGSTDNFLYALNMDNGARIWRFPTGSKIVSSPVVGFDHTIYIGSLDGFLYAINPDGTLKWRFDAKTEVRGSPALDRDGTIYFGTSLLRGEANKDNGLYAVSTSGQKKWFARNRNGFAAAPIIDDDSGTVVASSWDNRIYGANRKDGRLTPYKTFNDDAVSAAAMGMADYLFAGGKDGSFYAMDIERGSTRFGREEHWDYRLPRPIAGSSPVIRSGDIYIGTCENDGEEGSGALYSFLFGNNEGDSGPAGESPWPLFRNGSRNTGMTGLRAGTTDPEVAKTDPAPGVREFDTGRQSITARFSMPMAPESIYRAPGTDGPDDEGFFGFTVEPFDADPEEFEIDWNGEQTVFTLTLPAGESFERETQYIATIESSAHAEGDLGRRLLYDYEWTFRHDPEESHDNSHNRFTCFISSIWESSPLDFMADLW